MKSRFLLALCTASAVIGLAPTFAVAQNTKPIKIALIASKTGPSEQYARDTERGLRIGLDVLTQGTMTVLGRKIELIVKDDQFKPDLSKAMLTEAFGDDKADIAVGTSWSGGALSMAPVAPRVQEDPDDRAGDRRFADRHRWNRYLFRASRNSFQDALATAAGLKDGDSRGLPRARLRLRQGRAWRPSRTRWRDQEQGNIAHEEFIPLSTTDFTASMQRILDEAQRRQRQEVHHRHLGCTEPAAQAVRTEARGPGHRVPVDRWRQPREHQALGRTAGDRRHLLLLHLPEEPDERLPLSPSTSKRFKVPPDLFSAGGFVTAAAIIAGLKKAGTADTEKLIAAMEGMEFDTPKGKMTFRKEDHQAMQAQYQFRVKKTPGHGEWDLLDLVREIPASEMPVPLQREGAVDRQRRGHRHDRDAGVPGADDPLRRPRRGQRRHGRSSMPAR